MVKVTGARWITGVVLCAGVVIAAWWNSTPQAEARPRRMICEEWRDYYYNAETGDFVSWAGDAYWVCYRSDEPVSHPGSADPSAYGGGTGYPRDPDKPTCQECNTGYEKCMKGVRHGTNRCLTHYEQQALSWCIQNRRKKFGRPLEGSYRCETVRDPRGKPTRLCHGPAIDDCVESFAQDQPDVSVDNTDKINVGYDWWGVGRDRVSTVTWGGSRGYIEGCRFAAQEAGAVCLTELGTCEEAAGGCR